MFAQMCKQPHLWFLHISRLHRGALRPKYGRYVSPQSQKMAGSGTSSSVKMGVSGTNIGHFGTDFDGIRA